MIPVNLLIIIAVQFVVCVTTHALSRNRAALTGRFWFFSAWSGLVLGFAMDIVLGAYGVFAYLPDGIQGAAVEPSMLPLPTLFFNAVLSYGLAVSTFAFIARDAPTTAKNASAWVKVVAVVITVGVVSILAVPSGSLPMMVACGVVIIGCGEAVLLKYGLSGPIIALLSNASVLPLARLWAFSIGVGSIYEIANWLHPFWVWLPQSEIPPSTMRVVMILMGYVALSHPMFVFWTVARHLPHSRH